MGVCGWEGWAQLTEQGGGQRWRVQVATNTKKVQAPILQNLDFNTRLTSTSSASSPSKKVFHGVERVEGEGRRLRPQLCVGSVGGGPGRVAELASEESGSLGAMVVQEPVATTSNSSKKPQYAALGTPPS